MFVDRNGKIDENTKSEDIVKLIYRHMFKDSKLSTETIREALQKTNQQAMLIFLVQQIIRQKKASKIVDNIPEKRIDKNGNCISDNEITKITISVLLNKQVAEVPSIVQNYDERITEKVKNAIIGALTDAECGILFSCISDYNTRDIPIEVYECLLSQFPKDNQTNMIQATLQTMETTEYGKVLKVLYSGIKLSIGKNFKKYLTEHPDDDHIGTEIKSLQDITDESIKVLLIKYGLKTIKFIKRIEDQMVDTPQKLDKSISLAIAHTNANMHSEPTTFDRTWCEGASSRGHAC